MEKTFTATSEEVPGGTLIDKRFLNEAEAYQDHSLQLVSRTFALTIPQLPPLLRKVVGNAYLLCRIMDTIEDDEALSVKEKQVYGKTFLKAVSSRYDAEVFATEVVPLLSPKTLGAERDLLSHAPFVIAIKCSFNSVQQQAVERCLRIMWEGMRYFVNKAGLQGLDTQSELIRYCYHVAGVVGEMLTELFCDYSPEIARNRHRLQQLAVAFGNALQLTNILKDQWEDRRKGVCWLPRELFEYDGLKLSELTPGHCLPPYKIGLTQLLSLAHCELRGALEYTLLIPKNESGIRRFCFWAIDLAAMTLRNIRRKPDFTTGRDIKVKRSQVSAMILLTNLATRSNTALTFLFNLAIRGVPLSAADTASPGTPQKTAGQDTGFSDKTEASVPAGIDRQQLDVSISQAREGLLKLQQPDGHWCFEFETNCTSSAELIMMMHFTGNVDQELQKQLAQGIRARQVYTKGYGGWSLFPEGIFDLSGSVKAYYALKLAGDHSDAPHMCGARQAILSAGGAAKSNVLTRVLLAIFGQIPWRGVPFLPVEIMLMPKWSPFHLNKFASWARPVMVPLSILCTLKARAKNPGNVNIPELFAIPSEREPHYFSTKGVLSRILLPLDKLCHICEPAIPKRLRRMAMKRAEEWLLPRMNKESGIAGLAVAITYTNMALDRLGYGATHPLRKSTEAALRKLMTPCDDGSVHVQHSISPCWDTGWAATALQHSGEDSDAPMAIQKAAAWLSKRQVQDLRGEWAAQTPALAPGGWAFQYHNDYYPDLDDTAMITCLLHTAGNETPGKNPYQENIERAADWLAGLQSRNGGFAAYDADNTCAFLNHIPFSDYEVMIDPPTEDISARVLTTLGLLNREKDQLAIQRCIHYLKQAQQADGAFFGRWGVNYIYGTWSVLTGLTQAGEDPGQPYIRRAIKWLKSKQHTDGGWGETCRTYHDPCLRGSNNGVSIPETTAWSILALLEAGEVTSEAVQGGVEYLLINQRANGLWKHPYFNGCGHPQMAYCKYHGYSAYFPLMALARYRTLKKKAYKF